MTDVPTVDRSEGARPANELDALRAALAASGTGTWWWDAATGDVHWDETLEALYGLGPGGFGATFDAWVEALHPDERGHILEVVDDAMARRGSYRFEHRAVWPDGSVHWIECRGEVLVDDEGAPAGTVGCALDVSGRKAFELEQAALLDLVQDSAGRLVRLQAVSRALAGALTVDDVVTAVLESLDPPAGASTRILWLSEPTSQALVLAGQRGMDPATVEQFARIPADADLPGPVALRERRTVVSPSEDDCNQRFPELRGTTRTAPGFVAVPLLLETEALGVLVFGFAGTLDDSDVTFLEAAAGHIAQTLQRVRLASALEQRSEQLALLAAITRAAVTASDHRDLMEHVAATVVPRLGEHCAIQFVPEPGAAPETVVARSGYVAWARDGMADGAASQVFETGEVHVEPHVATVPLRGEGRINGVLQVVAGDTPPAHDDRHLALVQAVADAVGEALQSRWLTDQHRHISLSLQQAFLPPTVKVIPHLDIASAYWPAGVASEVGGDFYDVFALGEDEWAVLIGDACGTGPDAAATAAIARHTARAAARHGIDHCGVLEWVNQAVKRSDRDLFCTACYATVQVAGDGTVTLTVASGGHPLPVLVADGRAEAVGSAGTLLGVFDDPRFEVHAVTLAPGTAVVLYTDGLTDLPPPAGSTPEELASTISGAAAVNAEHLIAHLRADLEKRTSVHQRADDTAILVLRNPGTTA